MIIGSATHRTPLPILILGLLYLIGAINAFVGVVGEFIARHGFYLDLINLLGFFIGPGLIRGSRRWWTWAYVISWTNLVAAVFAFFVIGMMFSTTSHLQDAAPTFTTLYFYGKAVALSRTSFFELMVAAVVIWVILTLWSLWALNKNRWFFQ